MRDIEEVPAKVLRALHTFRSTPSPESYATSAGLLQDALRRDPNYARAYGALANGGHLEVHLPRTADGDGGPGHALLGRLLDGLRSR